MKKISLKNLNLKEVEQLSRDQLKNVLGGFTGGTGISGTGEDEGVTGDYDADCVRACGTGGRGMGDPCVTTDCKDGICGYWMNIYGCVAK